MKKVLMLLVLVALVSIGAFADDLSVGVNLKGFDNFDPMVSAELGWGTDSVVSPYLQVGIIQGSALAGARVNLGDSPAYLFGGAGVTLGQKVVKTKYAVDVNVSGAAEGTETHINTGKVITHEVSVETQYYFGFPVGTTETETDFESTTVNTSESAYYDAYFGAGVASFCTTDTFMVVLPTFELGAGIDMGFLNSKIGFAYVGNGEVNNYGFTFSMAASF